MTTQATLSAGKDRVLEANNPIKELFMRYPFDAGMQQAVPEYLNGVCADTDPVNAFVYISGYQSGPNDAAGLPTYSAVFSKCDPTDAAKSVAIGVIEYKTGATICTVRTLRGDIGYAGITAGSRYVIGTDGLPAKLGDSNYPTGKTFQVGIGLYPGRLLLMADTAAAISGNANRITAESSAVTNTAAETDFSRTLTLPANSLLPGQTLVIKGAVRVTAAVATHTCVLKVYLGSLVLFTSMAIDPVDAGDVISFRVEVDVRSIGTSGKIISDGWAGARGDVTGKAASGGGAGEQTLNTTTAPVIKASLTWSNADAGDSALLQKLRYSVE